MGLPEGREPGRILMRSASAIACETSHLCDEEPHLAIAEPPLEDGVLGTRVALRISSLADWKCGDEPRDKDDAGGMKSKPKRPSSAGSGSSRDEV
jgi:hypothetical protein